MKKIYLAEKGRIVCEEVPDPMPGAGEVLLKTKYTGICGTDIHAYAGRTIFGNTYPFNIGHEVIGIVEKTGDGCNGIEVGDHVVLDPLFTCGVCEYCRTGHSNHCQNKTSVGLKGPGGFSDYMVAPIGSVFKVPKDMPFKAAALAEPLSTVVNGISKLRPVFGGHVLINGYGAIGQMHYQMAKIALGAADVSVLEASQARYENAKQAGIENAFLISDPDLNERFQKIAPEGFDIIIDCTGAPASVEASLARMKCSGQLLVFGVCPAEATVAISPFDVYKKELSIMGSFSATKKSMAEAIELLNSGRIDSKKLISYIGSRDELQGILDDLVRGNVSDKLSGKVVLKTEA